MFQKTHTHSSIFPKIFMIPINIGQIFRSVNHFNSSSNKSTARMIIESIIVGLIYHIAKLRLYPFCLKKKTNQYSVHTLLSHMDIPFYIIGIYSLHRYLKYGPKFIIYDDGTLTEEDCRVVAKIPRAFIVKSSQAKKMTKKSFSTRSTLLLQRASAPHNRKLIDVLLYKKNNEKLLVLDSDVLFFRYPDTLLKFLTTNTTQIDMTYIQDMQNAYIAAVAELNRIFRTHCPPRLNSGVLAFRSDILTIPFVADYFHTIHTTFHNKTLFKPWIEQTGYALLASRVKSKPLPENYSIGTKYNCKTVCRHYVHDSRNDYVIDLLKLIF